MLALLIIFTSLLALFIVVGNFIILRTAQNINLLPFDRTFLAAWIGMAFIGSYLLIASFFHNLSYDYSLLILAPLIFTIAKSKASRESLRSLLSVFNLKNISVFLIITAIIAFLGTQRSDCGDTGNYHFQIAKWLSQFGSVPGIALIQHRLGFASSLYAIAAPFNDTFLENRIQGILGGILYIIFLLHTSYAMQRLVVNQNRAADNVILLAFLLIWPFKMFNVTSMSPNLAVIFGIPIALWCLFILHNDEESQTSSDSGCLLLVFCAAIASFKISALLLVVAVLLLLVSRKTNLKLLISTTWVYCSFLILPCLFYSFYASGYPFYPFSLFGFSTLAWSLSITEVNRVASIIHNYWWCGRFLSCDSSFFNKIWQWILADTSIVWLGILSLFSFIRLRHITDIRSNGKILIFAVYLEITAICMLILSGPSPTFALAWLTLLPVVALAIDTTFISNKKSFYILLFLLCLLHPRLSATRYHIVFCFTYALLVSMFFFYSSKKSHSNLFTKKTLSSATFVCFLLGSTIDMRLRLDPWSPKNFLLPSLIFEINDCIFESNAQGNFSYWLAYRTKGTQCQCWHKQVPCTLERPPSDTVLLDPQRGIAGGFARSASPVIQSSNMKAQDAVIQDSIWPYTSNQ